jgi:hypothetical protein
MKIGDSGPGSRNDLIRVYLERIRQAQQRGDLAGLLPAVRLLEKCAGAPRDNLIASFSLLADLAGRKGNRSVQVESLLKLINLLDTSPERRAMMLNELTGTVITFHNACPPEQAVAIKRHLETYLAENDPLVGSISEVESWERMIAAVFGIERGEQVIQLCLRRFRETNKTLEKGQAVMDYLNYCRWFRAKRDFIWPVATAKPLAEFLVREARACLKTDLYCDVEIFRTLIVNLVEFGFHDLVGEAIAIRRPSSSDAVLTYAQFAIAIAEDPEKALNIARGSGILDLARTERSSIIGEEIQALFVKTQRQVLERKTINVFTAKAPHLTGQFMTQICLSPRNAFKDLRRAINDVREKMLDRLKENVAVGDCFCLLLPVDYTRLPTGGGEISQSAEAVIVYDPSSKAIELYFPALFNPGQYVKLEYRVQIEEQRGQRIVMISPDSFYAGVEPARQNMVPLIWEILAIKALAIEQLVDGKVRGLLAKYRTLLEATERKLFVDNNSAAYNALRSSFLACPEYQSQQVELGNRERLAADIITRFKPKRAAIGRYELTQHDYLAPLVATIELADSPTGRRVEVHLRDERTLYLSVDSNNKIVVGPNLGTSDPLLERYINELVLTAIVKIGYGRADAVRLPADPVASYLLTGGGTGERDNSAVADLRNILDTLFLEELRAKGLSGTTWCLREMVGDEELYRPLEDQSLAGKRAAINLYGKENIYVQMRRLGVIERLPVRRKGEGIAPYERHSIREEQKDLLNDPQRFEEYHAVYVITEFSEGPPHLRLVSLRENLNDLFGGKLVEQVEQEVAAGNWRDPAKFLEGSSRRTRDKVLANLARGVTITGQKADFFSPIETTYRRPPMALLQKLEEAGYMLE